MIREYSHIIMESKFNSKDKLVRSCDFHPTEVSGILRPSVDSNISLVFSIYGQVKTKTGWGV